MVEEEKKSAEEDTGKESKMTQESERWHGWILMLVASFAILAIFIILNPWERRHIAMENDWNDRYQELDYAWLRILQNVNVTGEGMSAQETSLLVARLYAENDEFSSLFMRFEDYRKKTLSILHIVAEHPFGFYQQWQSGEFDNVFIRGAPLEAVNFARSHRRCHTIPINVTESFGAVIATLKCKSRQDDYLYLFSGCSRGFPGCSKDMMGIVAQAREFWEN